MTLYKKADDSQDDAEADKDREYREREERRNALETISKQAYQLRRNFIKEMSNSAAKKNLHVIIKYYFAPLVEGFYPMRPDWDDYIDFITPGINDKAAEKQLISDHIVDEPEVMLLVNVYLTLDGKHNGYFDWNGRYRNNEALNRTYEFLEKLGYEISEEELALKNGTHELFAPVGGKEK